MAEYTVNELQKGSKTVIDEIAAYLVTEHRTHELELVVRDIEAEFARRGLVVVDVTSADSLSEALERTVKSFVANAYGAQTVELRTSIDPALLGGVKVKTPFDELDGSLQRRITQLKDIKIKD